MVQYSSVVKFNLKLVDGQKKNGGRQQINLRGDMNQTSQRHGGGREGGEGKEEEQEEEERGRRRKGI